MLTKICPRCGECKPVAEFNSNRCRKDGLAVYCRPCTRQYANANYAAVAHDCIVSKAYNIERGQFASMLNAQKDVCAICGCGEKLKIRGKTKRLSIDHSHASGAVRALLCNRCNTIIGYAEDDAELLSKAIEYLHLHGA